MILFFSLCHPTLTLYARILYESMDSLVINSENIAMVYRELLRFEHLDDAVNIAKFMLTSFMTWIRVTWNHHLQ